MNEKNRFIFYCAATVFILFFTSYLLVFYKDDRAVIYRFKDGMIIECVRKDLYSNSMYCQVGEQ